MKIRSTKDQKEAPNAVDKFVGYTQTSYRSFQDYVAFRDDDPLWMLTYKIGLQFLGFLLMLLLSPFLILGLTIAIAAVL
jgi:hypothetical protein